MFACICEHSKLHGNIYADTDADSVDYMINFAVGFYDTNLLSTSYVFTLSYRDLFKIIYFMMVRSYCLTMCSSSFAFSTICNHSRNGKYSNKSVNVPLKVTSNFGKSVV